MSGITSSRQIHRVEAGKNSSRRLCGRVFQYHTNERLAFVLGDGAEELVVADQGAVVDSDIPLVLMRDRFYLFYLQSVPLDIELDKALLF